MGANIKHKDTLFSNYLSDPDRLREVYGALKGESIPADLPITVNTLENVLAVDRINDISFTVGGKLIVLLEHQSTVNNNMALRCLFYIAELYERTVDKKAVHGGRRVRIPRPEFFVLYNGAGPCPDESVQKLSEMFEDTAAILGGGKSPAVLELEVTVLNINHGRDKGLARKCKAIAEYSAFIAKVRECKASGLTLEDAMKAAVDYCIENGILKEYLEKRKGEVIDMLTAELTIEEYQELWFEEGMEKGMEEGMEQGIEKGMEKGMEQGSKKEREDVLRLINQGLSVEELKQRLMH